MPIKQGLRYKPLDYILEAYLNDNAKEKRQHNLNVCTLTLVKMAARQSQMRSQLELAILDRVLLEACSLYYQYYFINTLKMRMYNSIEFVLKISELPWILDKLRSFLIN